ncbi:MAG: GntR family transcriptional regulator [Ruminococcus sp.]|nr:GntR family transcriptional regulator [Ruminococcus sp.]
MPYNFDNNLPIYIQLVEIIRIDIVSGKLPKGQKIPSVREMAVKMQVNPNTMQKALAELENEGLIYTERTNGKYVTEDEGLIEKTKTELAQQKVINFINDMQDIGIDLDKSIEYLNEFGGKNEIS